MCGIIGFFDKKGNAARHKDLLLKAAFRLKHRGPDNQGSFISNDVLLGHTRLSVIDTSINANQPLTDDSNRYTIVFNGEIYNYKEIRKALILKGVNFKTNSDTEVLLYAYIHYGNDCLSMLNGFFAFAVYDTKKKLVFVARDRLGIKPLYCYNDENCFIFSSEIRGILAFKKKKQINREALYHYLQLNYIPEPYTIFNDIQKVKKGTFLTIDNLAVTEKTYYKISIAKGPHVKFNVAAKQLHALVNSSVEKRMISDVPIGSFLSGGLDSSVIAACAREHTNKLNTYSIGFLDEPVYDESKYAELMAKHLNTEHTSFMLSNDDLYDHLYEVLNNIDEPFADSSSIAVSILSKQTRKHVTVALSGDGGDELFGGYNKHKAELIARSGGGVGKLAAYFYPIWRKLPKSRNSSISNIFRQLEKLGHGIKLSEKERYWEWCTFSSESSALKCLNSAPDMTLAQNMKNEFLKFVNCEDFNSVLANDIHLVLANDMLTKVDRMSMAHSLEVRVPLLDHEIVDFSMRLPSEFKINHNQQKHILKEAFKGQLPKEILNRKKHGFEVPLLKWFRGGLFSEIDSNWLNKEKISDQGLFNSSFVEQLKQQLFKKDCGDAPLDIWKLIVFQQWYDNYIES